MNDKFRLSLTEDQRVKPVTVEVLGQGTVHVDMVVVPGEAVDGTTFSRWWTGNLTYRIPSGWDLSRASGNDDVNDEYSSRVEKQNRESRTN